MNRASANTRMLGTIGAVLLLLAGSARPQADYQSAARAFVAELVAGKYEAAAKRFDETMTSAFPVPKLQEVWNSVISQAGAYREITSASQVQAQGYEIVLLTTRFEQTSMVIRVVFDSESRIAGLFFAPVQASAPWAPAEYAHQDSFLERSVTVGHAPWQLPGTLTVPKGEGKFAAVVLVHGSGAHDANETIGPNKPFKDLAWGLASRGVAVLRYEKRGHKYAKELSALKTATVREETVEDAQAAVDLLATLPEIDAKRIFVVGHSLGAMLAPRIAAGNVHVAGLVMLAGNSRPLEILLIEQVKYLAQLDGTVSEAEQKQIDELETEIRLIKDPELKPDATVSVLGRKVPGSYFIDLRNYAPAEAAAKLRIPLLVLWGERDYQVRAADFEGWKKALAERKDAACKSYPALNHLFIAGKGPGSPSEYAAAGHVDGEVVSDIASWILKSKL